MTRTRERIQQVEHHLGHGAHRLGREPAAYENLDLEGEIADVWGPAPNDIWGVGSFGSFVHFDGSAWTDVLHQRIGAPYLRQFFGVHGSSADDVWIVGRELGANRNAGIILHR